MKSVHPGFAKVADMISSKENIPAKNAGAILAARTRNASAGAKRKNPRLLKVKG